MNNINKIKIGCGAVFALLCLGFYLVPLWYGRERSQEDLDKDTLEEIKRDVQTAENNLGEAAAALSRQEYSEAYQKAMYGALNIFSTYSRGLSFEIEPGRDVQQWLTEKKAEWRKKVNDEFDSQAKIFEGLKDPDAILAVGERLQQLSDNYRTEYRELYEKFRPKLEAIKKARLATAGKTVYVSIRDGSHADSQFFMKLRDEIKKDFLSKWDNNGKYRLSFATTWYNAYEERTAAVFCIDVEVIVYFQQYETVKQKVPVSVAVPKKVTVSFKPFPESKAKTSWNDLQAITFVEECPDYINGYDALSFFEKSNEAKMVKSLQAQLGSVPAFAVENTPPAAQKPQVRSAQPQPSRPGSRTSLPTQPRR